LVGYLQKGVTNILVIIYFLQIHPIVEIKEIQISKLCSEINGQLLKKSIVLIQKTMNVEAHQGREYYTLIENISENMCFHKIYVAVFSRAQLVYNFWCIFPGFGFFT
jgi:hypothetical protein